MSGIERGDKPFFPSDDDTLGDPPGPLGHAERVAELEAAEQRLVTSGPGQNVDRTVAWFATMHGLPVPDELVLEPEE